MHATPTRNKHAKSSKVTAVNFCLQEVRGEKLVFRSPTTKTSDPCGLHGATYCGFVCFSYCVFFLPFFSRHSATPCGGACVELEPDTEAVANKGFKLGCISCKMRGEVRAVASVSWSFKAVDEEDFSPVSGNKPQQTILHTMCNQKSD